MMNERKPSAFDADETEALQEIGWRQSASPSSCPDSALLLAVEEGVLEDVVAKRVRDHVAGCATCQLLMKDLASVLGEGPDEAAAGRIRTQVRTGTEPRRAHPYIWWGAGLAVAAGLTWFVMMPRPTSSPVPTAEVARVTPTPIPSVFVVNRPNIPPGDVDLAVRGESSKRVSLEDQIAAALDKADKSDLAGASADLETLFKKHQTSRIAALALGAVQLRAGQNADAAATLERARTLKGDKDTADEAGWFLGIALARTGDADRARSILDDVCKNHGPRSTSACAGIAEIDRNKSGR